jgi:hypothetical protein
MNDQINELLSSLAETLDGYVAKRIEMREKMAEQFETMPLGDPQSVDVPVSLPLSLRVSVLEKKSEARAMGQERIEERIASFSQRLCSLEENAPPLDASDGGFTSQLLKRVEALEKHANDKAAHDDTRRRIEALELRAGLIPPAYSVDKLADWMPIPRNEHAERLSGLLRPPDPPQPDPPQPQRAMTMLEQIQRERELNQKALLDIRLAKSDREELQRYRNHTPSGKPRYGTPEYKAAFEADQLREKELQKTRSEIQQAANERAAERVIAWMPTGYKPGFVDT